MSAIEALKEQARNHEQKEEWPKALDLYKKAIEKLAAEEALDIGLYNRVADIQVRQGQIPDAVVHYEKAIDLYIEAELPNNAIAVCKKIVRNMPQRHTVYLRMGQIRGKQGLLADARQNFFTYAERMQAEGNLDEGLRSLGELADLVEDGDIRLAVAAQLQSHGRTADAVAQLQSGYRAATQRGLPTAAFEQMLRQLEAEPSLSGPPSAAAPVADDDEMGRGEITLAPPAAATEEPEIELGGFEIALSEPAEEQDTPLPTLDFGSEEAADEEEEEYSSDPLPLMTDSFGDEPTISGVELDASALGESDKDDREDGLAELPELEIGISLEGPPSAPAREAAMEEARPQPVAPAPPPPVAVPQPTAALAADPMGHESLAARGDIKGAMDALRKLIATRPDDIALRQRLVEYAFRLKDESALVPVWLELADALEGAGQSTKARPVYQQVLGVDPQNAKALQALGQAPKPAAGKASEVASSESYVDLGSLLFDEEEEKTTRFVVAYEEPSGDEQADFKKMLSQFKAKVAENLSADDVKAHQDLGTAYKEMGLTDEAISEFQQALRASANHLPSYELLGQCFMEKGEPGAAVRTLSRALQAPFEFEDELLGIYYYLGRAHQQLGNTKDALEFYDRVFTLDINFADVTERLRALR